MTLTEVLGFAWEALFVLLSLRALDSWRRRRDPLSRAVAFMFAPFAAAIAVQVLGIVLGPVSDLIRLPALFLFLAQPLFALHLASLITAVPRRVLLGLTAMYGVTMGAALVLVPVQVPLTVLLLFEFVLIEVAAAGYIASEARRRRRPSSLQLGMAAGATALFALAILVATLGALVPDATAFAADLALACATAAGLGFVLVFMPPRWVRRVWQAGVVVGYQRQLLARTDESIDVIWTALVDFTAGLVGSPACIVVPRDDAPTVWRSGGDPVSLTLVSAGPRPEDLAASFQDTDVGTLPWVQAVLDVCPPAWRVATRFVSVVPLAIEDGPRVAALVVLAAHRSLFQQDDLALLRTLGTQTAQVAERRAVMAERELLAARLEQTVEALQEAGRAKSDFVSSMSHELRTPLSAILGFSELLRSEPVDGDSVRVPLEWIEHIHRGGEHLLALVNDVLDLARVESGRLELQLEDVDLRGSVHEWINGMRPLADRKGIDLVLDVPAFEVAADRGRLRQVVYNLVSNAIKFTPEGGRVTVRAERTEDATALTVADTGIGIAPEDLDIVFEEFRQVGSEESRAEGTGLGLPLSRRLVEAHGGTLSAESTVGKGSRFTVLLPDRPAVGTSHAAAPAGSVSTAPASEPEPEPVEAASAGPEAAEVLIIEDDPSAVRLLREYLDGAGYASRAAADGLAGISQARAHRPAAIILDVLLPGIDGWEVLRRIKADPDLQSVPVVMVTVVDEREIGIALGAADYLIKPIRREAVLASLSRLIQSPTRAAGPVRVLAVDDEREALALIDAALADPTYEVIHATGGREALDLARGTDVDVVLCDLLMPDIDGFEVVARLKADPATSSIPIIVVTAHDLTDAEHKRLRGDILGIVAKGRSAQEGLRAWLARMVTTTDRAGVETAHV